jgi:hypothetical protein
LRSDDIVSIGEFKASCPKCGADLSIKHDGIKLKGDERMICPTHGDAGSLKEARRIVLEKSRDNVIDQTKKFAIDNIRGSFRRLFK